MLGRFSLLYVQTLFYHTLVTLGLPTACILLRFVNGLINGSSSSGGGGGGRRRRSSSSSSSSSLAIFSSSWRHFRASTGPGRPGNWLIERFVWVCAGVNLLCCGYKPLCENSIF